MLTLAVMWTLVGLCTFDFAVFLTLVAFAKFVVGTILPIMLSQVFLAGVRLVRWPHTSRGKEWPSKKQGAQGEGPKGAQK
jgi:hypothetical protein